MSAKVRFGLVDLGTITSAAATATLPFRTDDNFVLISCTVFPKTAGSPNKGGADGLKFQMRSSSASVAKDHGAVTGIATALDWGMDDFPAGEGEVTWDGTADGSSTVGLEAFCVWRKSD